MKTAFGGPIILCGGYDAQTAQRDLDDSLCDLVAVGRPFISNPRLLNQWKEGAPLEAPQFATFYTPGPAGYI
jgi:N-ethylmaleimide reductase